MKRSKLGERWLIGSFRQLGQTALSFLNNVAGFLELAFGEQVGRLGHQRAQSQDFGALLSGWSGRCGRREQQRDRQGDWHQPKWHHKPPFAPQTAAAGTARTTPPSVNAKESQMYSGASSYVLSVTPHDVLVNCPLGQVLAAASFVADFEGEPLGEPFAVAIAVVAIVENVAQLVDQHIVEIEITNRVFRPDEAPIPLVTDPPRSVH